MVFTVFQFGAHPETKKVEKKVENFLAVFWKKDLTGFLHF